MSDEICKYFEGLKSLAKKASDQSLSAMDVLDDRTHKDFSCLSEKLINSRSLLISDVDRNRCSGYLELGFFTDFDTDKKIAAWATLFDLEDEIAIINLQKTCAPYTKDQMLFREAPNLWDKVRISGKRPPELINISGIKWDPTGQLALLENTKARLNDYLRPEIVGWLKNHYDNGGLFARLDPHNASPNLMAVLNEEIIRPADPKWWKDLSIWPNDNKVGVYELLNCSPKDNMGQFWEYNIKNLGRLEVLFQKNNSGTISGMLEEIPRRCDKGFIIGYCLHLTSDSPIGTEWEAGIATHIDGAINVYVGDTTEQRWENGLQYGKVCDATFRTHLFRADNIPLKAVIPLACMFFRSKYLLADWLSDQFKELFQ